MYIMFRKVQNTNKMDKFTMFGPDWVIDLYYQVFEVIGIIRVLQKFNEPHQSCVLNFSKLQEKDQLGRCFR